MSKPNYNYKNWCDRIFSYFQDLGAGHGCMLFKNLQNAYYNRQHSKEESSILQMMVFNLQDNGYLQISDAKSVKSFVLLTETGHDYMQGGDITANSIELSSYVDVSKTDIDNLWLLVGVQYAPFYLEESKIYEALIQVDKSLESMPFSAFLQMRRESGKSVAVRAILRESWSNLTEDLRKRLLSSLSIKISETYNKFINHNTKIPSQPTTMENNTYNINAAVVNTGSGNISTGNVELNNISQNIGDNADVKQQFLDVLKELKHEAAKLNNEDVNDAVEVLETETKKDSWSKKALKLGLNAIQGVSAGIIANGLTPLVAKAVALLSFL